METCSWLVLVENGKERERRGGEEVRLLIGSVASLSQICLY